MRPKILIAEDDYLLMSAIKKLLAINNYELFFATNGSEALTSANLVRPDMILLDIMMPVMDGFEVLRQVRQNPELAEIPVVIFTALDDDQTVQKALELGADDFITKPYTAAALLARIASITRLNRYRAIANERYKFEWVVENSDDGYIIIDEADAIQYTNSSAEKLLAIPPNPDGSQANRFLDIAKKIFRLEPETAWANWPPRTAQSERISVRTSENTIGYLISGSGWVRNKSIWIEVQALPIIHNQAFGWLLRLRDISSQMNLQNDFNAIQTIVNQGLNPSIDGLIQSLESLIDDQEQFLLAENKPRVKDSLAEALEMRNNIKKIIQRLENPASKHGIISVNEFIEVLEQMATEIGSAVIQVDDPLGIRRTRLMLKIAPSVLEAILWEILAVPHNSTQNQNGASPTQLSLIIGKPAGLHLPLLFSFPGINIPNAAFKHLEQPRYDTVILTPETSTSSAEGLRSLSNLVWSAGGELNITNHPDPAGLTIEIRLPVQLGAK